MDSRAKAPSYNARQRDLSRWGRPAALLLFGRTTSSVNRATSTPSPKSTASARRSSGISGRFFLRRLRRIRPGRRERVGSGRACEAMPDEVDAHSAVIAGLDPAIHPFRKKPLMRRRWTRGSSPRVTPECVSTSSGHALAIKDAATGGEGGIRTPDTVARMPHFECGAFNHSATSPGRRHSAAVVGGFYRSMAQETSGTAGKADLRSHGRFPK